jgi:hypothetical protein
MPHSLCDVTAKQGNFNIKTICYLSHLITVSNQPSQLPITMSSDEWTFVKSNSRNRRHQKGPAQGRSVCPGLYRSNSQQGRDDAVTEKSQTEQIRNAIVDCIDSQERQYQSGKGFAARLINALDDLSSGADLHEIVVYGIGNFSQLYSASMLQLAGALLLRRLAAAKKGTSGENGVIAATNNGGDDVSTSFRRDQQRVPIYYYEPCILGAEKELLEEVFCIQTLESNHMGKLSVLNTRQNSVADALQEGERGKGIWSYFEIHVILHASLSNEVVLQCSMGSLGSHQ